MIKWSGILALVLLIPLSASAAAVDKPLDVNYCFDSSTASSSWAASECSPELAHGYHLSWYDLPHDMRQNEPIKAIGKITRLPSPPDEDAKSDDVVLVAVEEAFVLVCRAGAFACLPAPTQQLPADFVLLHKLELDGPFDLKRTEAGLDAEEFKLKSIDFVSSVAERITLVFAIKLSNHRLVAIKLARDVLNGQTKAVQRVSTAQCTVSSSSSSWLVQMEQEPNHGGLTFTVENPTTAWPATYHMGILEYGSSHHDDARDVEWFAGEASDGAVAVGDLQSTAFPLTARELSFTGPNSVLGRTLVVSESKGGKVVVGECLPAVHTVLADDEEDASEADDKTTTRDDDEEVPNAVALQCQFKESGSVVRLEFQEPSSDGTTTTTTGGEAEERVLVRYALTNSLHVLRHAKSNTTLVPPAASPAGAYYLVVDGGGALWARFPIGSTMQLGTERCSLARAQHSTHAQLEFPGKPRAPSPPASAVVPLVTTASCTFPELGQLVFYRTNRAQQDAAAMVYMLGSADSNTSSTAVRVDFYEYGAALREGGGDEDDSASEINSVAFSWTVPPPPPLRPHDVVITGGEVAWPALDLDVLVGRLARATVGGSSSSSTAHFCVVKRDASSAHYVRAATALTTAMPPRAAHCLLHPITTVTGRPVLPFSSIAVWFKQHSQQQQSIEIKLNLTLATGGGAAAAGLDDDDDEDARMYDLYTLHPNSGQRRNARVLRFTVPPTGTFVIVDSLVEYSAMEGLYGSDLGLYAVAGLMDDANGGGGEDAADTPPLLAQGVVAALYVPQTQPPTTVAQRRKKTLRPSSSSSSSAAGEDADDDGGDGAERNSSTIPLILLAVIFGVLGCGLCRRRRCCLTRPVRIDKPNDGEEEHELVPSANKAQEEEEDDDDDVREAPSSNP